MANKAFQRIYTQLEGITKATVSLKAAGVSNDELAVVDGRLAQVVKTKGDLVTLQIFSGTVGMPWELLLPSRSAKSLQEGSSTHTESL